MPKSKRNQLVALTQTSKKTREHKASIIQQVRKTIDGTQSVYLFSFENMRSSKFKKIRMHFRDTDQNKNTMMTDDSTTTTSDTATGSRIFLGKNRLLQIALGRTPEDEYADNLRRVSKLIAGSVGLLCTNRERVNVLRYFAQECREADYARAGDIATRTIVLTPTQIELHPVSMVDQFRKLGLPVDVNNGRLTLPGGRTEHSLCQEGHVLSVETCKLLLHFGIQLSEFRVNLLCVWNKETGEFESL